MPYAAIAPPPRPVGGCRTPTRKPLFRGVRAWRFRRMLHNWSSRLKLEPISLYIHYDEPDLTSASDRRPDLAAHEVNQSLNHLALSHKN